MPAGLRAAAGLADRGRWGRVPRLTDSDWRQVERALLAGALAQGPDTDLWTLPQAVDAIAEDGATSQAMVATASASSSRPAARS